MVKRVTSSEPAETKRAQRKRQRLKTKKKTVPMKDKEMLTHLSKKTEMSDSSEEEVTLNILIVAGWLHGYYMSLPY